MEAMRTVVSFNIIEVRFFSSYPLCSFFRGSSGL